MSDREDSDLFDGGESEIAKLRADERRQAAAQLVHGVYRLVKACLLHGDANQAVTSAVSGCVSAVAAFCELIGESTAVIQFAEDSVFVNGQMLKASRDTYVLVMELGGYFEVCGVTDVSFERSVGATEVTTFGRLVAEGQRDARLAKALVGYAFRSIRVRRVKGGAAEGRVAEDTSPSARIVRTYAASIVVMRAFYDEERGGSEKLLHRVKRVAQKLVSHIEEDGHLLVATSVSCTVDRDRATIAVSSATIALGMALQLTADRSVLAAVAMAALLYDVGRLRIARSGGAERGGLERSLSDTEMQRLPASSVVAMTALGRLHAQSVTRTVIMFESHWLRHGVSRGPAYGGRRAPWVTSRILSVARAFTELRMPGPRGAPIPVDDATQLLHTRAADATDRALVKLLIGALGVFPAGTMVELTNGAMGIVMETPAHPIDFARPRVRVMYDARGTLLGAPIDIDLSEVRGPQQLLMIKRSIDAEDQHLKAMRSYVQAAAAAHGVAPQRPVAARASPVPKSPGPAPAIRPSPLPQPSEPIPLPDAPAGAPSLQDPTLSAVAPAPPVAPASKRDPAAGRHSSVSMRRVGARASKPIERSQEPVVARPPSERPPPARPPGAPVSGQTPRVSWEDYHDMIGLEAPVPFPVPPTEPPSSSVPPESPPLSARDKLLSAFLADEPIEDPKDPTPPPRER